MKCFELREFPPASPRVTLTGATRLAFASGHRQDFLMTSTGNSKGCRLSGQKLTGFAGSVHVATSTAKGSRLNLPGPPSD